MSFIDPKSRPFRYRIYIDETGNPDLESSDNPNHRFLSLTGVILELDYVRRVLSPQMESLKSKYFGSHPDDPVIFHRKEMMNGRHPFEVLKSDEIRLRFDKELLELLSYWNYVVITVCIDKKKHKETYSTWRFEPYHYCLAVLLERFAFFLDQNGSKGDVIAESRGGREDTRLKDSFERLWMNGTEYIDPKIFQGALNSRQLKVKLKSNNIAGLQLADLIAHSSRDEILAEQGIINRNFTPFASQIISILQSKYYQHGGPIYGKKFI